MVESFSRRSPAAMPGASGGAAAALMTARRSRSPPAGGPGRPAGSGSARHRPGRGLRHAAGRRPGYDRTSRAATGRRDRTVQRWARKSAVPCAARSVFSSARSVPSRVLRVRGTVGTPQRPGRATGLLLRRRLRPRRARGAAAGPRKVLITHRRLAGRDEDMLGDDLSGGRHHRQQPPSSVRSCTWRADQLDRHRVAG